MANNDELAMQARADFESWWEVHYHNGNPPRFGWAAYREDGGYKIDDDESELDAMWNAWRAAQNCMLAERDADKKRIAEQDKSIAFLKEQLSLLANFNPDWDKLEAAYDSLREHMAALTASQKRIAELESRQLDIILPPRRCFDYAALAVQERDEQWHKALHDACKRGGIKLEVGE